MNAIRRLVDDSLGTLVQAWRGIGAIRGSILWAGLVVGVIVAICVGGRLAHAAEDERFLAALRERALFRLAEVHCLEQLQRNDLSDERRAALVIELSRTFAAHAQSLTVEQGKELWEQARSVVGQFVEQHPTSPRRSLVELQGALVSIAQGERLGEQLAGPPADAQAGAAYRAPFEVAIATLRLLDEQVEHRLRAAPRTQVDEPFDTAALRGLQRRIRFHLAQAYLKQARGFVPGGADANNAATQALESFEPVASSQIDDELTWSSRLARVTCYRLLRDSLRTSRALQQLRAQPCPAEIELLARAEEIRVALEFDRIDDLQKLVTGSREVDGRTSPELDLARLEGYLACWLDANRRRNQSLAQQWQARAEQAVREIEAEHGQAWSRRAEMLLASRLTSSPQVADLTLLERVADGLYRREQFDEALNAYDRARETAEVQGQREVAFQMGYKAAAIEHQRDAHEAAVKRYRQLSLGKADHPQAAEAHLLAVHHAAQLARRANGDLSGYEELLNEHLRNWPRGATANAVRLRLSRVKLHQADWSSVIQILEGLSAESAQYVESLDTIGTAYEALLIEAEAASRPTTPLAEDAALFFEQIAAGPERRLPERMSPAQQRAALWASRFWIDHYRGNYDRPILLLRAALRSNAPQPAERGEFLTLLIVALAAHDQTGEPSKP